jgi:hypothetical protein
MPFNLPIGSFQKTKNTYSTPGIRVFPTQHPRKQNKDSSESNVLIFGYQPKKNSPIYAIPQMVNGVELPENDAIKIAEKIGLDKYPRHKTVDEHNKWAEKFHGDISESGVLMKRPISFSIDELLKMFKQ